MPGRRRLNQAGRTSRGADHRRRHLRQLQRQRLTIDTTAPAAPQITAPADGSTTTDTTPRVRGTGEPGASGAASINGVPIGTAVVGADGRFAVPVTDPLNPGPDF